MFNLNCIGQTLEWVQRHNYANNTDVPYKIVSDNVGNVYVVGISVSSESPHLSGYVTIKYNIIGELVWSEFYFPPGITNNHSSGAYGVEVDEFGNVYVSGEMCFGPDAEDYDILTIKYSSNGGDPIWENVWGNSNRLEFGRDLTLGSDGFVYVTGLVALGINTASVVVKINPIDGSTIWSLLQDEFPYYDTRIIDKDNQSNIYIAGYCKTGVNYLNDYYVAKVDENGNLIWMNIYNGPGNTDDAINSIYINQLNDVFVTGGSFGIDTYFDITTIKYNSSGIEEAVVRFNGEENKNDVGNSIKGDYNGNIYVAGLKGDGRPVVIKYDAFLNEFWHKPFIARGFSPYRADAFSLAIDISSNVYVMGNFERTFTSEMLDILVYKLTPEGEQEWFFTYDYENLNDGSISGGITGRKIVLDAQNNIYVIGTSNSILGGEDFATLKISHINFSDNLMFYSNTNNEIIRDFSLKQNYPNPFNPSTKIEYYIPEQSFVKITVYDLLGKEVAVLVNEIKQTGSYDVYFNSASLSSGIYFYKMEAKESISSGTEFSEMRKMILMK